MRADHLKEAQQIVDSIKLLDRAMTLDLAATSQQNLTVVYPGERSVTTVLISKDAAAVAMAFQKKEWAARRAALVRRANQIGLMLS